MTKDKITFKNWFCRLFCVHNNKEMKNLELYANAVALGHNLPSRIYLRWICIKCGKIKKVRIV